MHMQNLITSVTNITYQTNQLPCDVCEFGVFSKVLSYHRQQLRQYRIILTVTNTTTTTNIGSAKSFFFLNAQNKTIEYFLKFLFYLKVQPFWLIMEDNFIQMAGHAVAYTIGSIFRHIIDFVHLYFTMISQILSF